MARQLLLERAPIGAADAIERVAGLQAQAARPPFIGLWTRLRGFEPDELRGLVESREVVRGTMMRHTVHLVTRADYLRLRAAIQPALERMFGGITSKRVTPEQLDAVVAAARKRFKQRAQTFAEIRALIADLLPDADLDALSYGVRTRLWLIAEPSGGPWCYGGRTPYALAERFLGEPVPRDDHVDELIVRYLAAFGPATVADIQAWSGRSGLKGAVEAQRGRLRTFRDERGRELFDVPDAPLPDPGTPAPARFLADWDNTILSHADRTRVIADDHRKLIVKAARVYAVFLLDGFVAGMWTLERKGRTVTLIVTPFRRVAKVERAALEAEAEPLLALVEPEAASRAVRFAAPA